MLKRMMIMQTLIAVLGQLIMGATALSCPMTGAKQQVGAEIACKYKEGTFTVEKQYVPVPPQGLSDADLSVSFAHYGHSVQASLKSVFLEDQVTASGSAYASAVWGQQPADACDVHGGNGSMFDLYFINSAPVYLNINGQINIDINLYPNLAPWETFVYVKLSSDDGTGMTEIWKDAANGIGGDKSKPIGHGLLLEADQIYLLEAYAESGTVASKDHTGFKSRTASFSITANCSCIVPDVINMTEVDAETAINAACLVKGVVTHDNSDTVDAGLVMDQNPIAETYVDCGSAVDLVISDGPGGEMPLLPDLEGEFGQVKLKEPVNVGDKIKTKIIVTNNGFIALAHKQTIDIEICLRPCDVIGDAQDIPVMTLDDLSVSSLQAGKSRKFNADIIVPVDIEGGEYRLAAKVDSSNDVIEFIEINNTAISECFEILGGWQ